MNPPELKSDTSKQRTIKRSHGAASACKLFSGVGMHVGFFVFFCEKGLEIVGNDKYTLHIDV